LFAEVKYEKIQFNISVFSQYFFWLLTISHALLSQSVSPDESWLTIYQNIDRAWVVEKVTLSLEEGENRFFLTGDNLLRERLYFHPLDPLTSLKPLLLLLQMDIRLKLRLKKPVPILFSFPFFMSGFNWKGRYMAIWDERNSLFTFIPQYFSPITKHDLGECAYKLAARRAGIFI